MADRGLLSPLKVKMKHKKNQIFGAAASSATEKAPKHQILSLLQMQTGWMGKKKPTQPLKLSWGAAGSKVQGGSALRNQTWRLHANPHPKTNGSESQKSRMQRMSRSREGRKDLRR